MFIALPPNAVEARKQVSASTTRTFILQYSSTYNVSETDTQKEIK